jgi:two-component system chemotaxis response regulator CheB
VSRAVLPARSTLAGGYDLVAVGASLGGVSALRALLGDLPAGFPVPIVVVQHRAGDSGALERESPLPSLLAEVTTMPVVEPRDREEIQPGTVYLAPAGYHLLVEPGVLSLSVEAPVCYARPSIDVLFETAAEAYGRRLVAILLTCSSEDGAAGIGAVARRGGLTVVEDPDSAHSPVAGRLALSMAPVRHVLSLGRIATVLAGMAYPEKGAG